VAIPFDRLSGIARRELEMSCLLHLLLAWTAVTALAGYTTRVFVDGAAPITTMTITYARRGQR